MELRETEFRKWLGKHLTDQGAHVTNIESSTKNGIPDTYVQIPGCHSFWLELKIGTAARTLLRPEQRIWGMKHHRAGGRAYVLAFAPSTGECYVWGHPIVSVDYAGKYLRILDQHLLSFMKGGVFNALSTLNL